MCNIAVKGLWWKNIYDFVCIFLWTKWVKYFTVQQAAAEKKPSVAAFKRRRLRHTQLLLLHSFAAKGQIILEHFFFQRKNLTNSALPPTKWSNQKKIKTLSFTNYRLLNVIKCLYFFDMATLYVLCDEFVK